MENNITIYHSHRVGSITAGVSMVVFGTLLFGHTVFGFLSYENIFSFWPLMLIGLGVELLLSNFSKKRIVYDKAAVFILILMTFFTMSIAVIDVWLQYTASYLR